ncbi:MAG TPA: MBL fold metallo-hydrolase, partial [Nitrospira sp.]
MLVHVLGSAAGGGFPQWNCGCPNCRGQRLGLIPAKARTQTSVAVSHDGHTWFLLHASPDIRIQIERTAVLHPRSSRHSPIAGILLTNGDLDQVLGLLSLRENQSLHVYATDRVRHGFMEGNSLYGTLCRTPDQVTWHALKLTVTDQLLLTAEGLPSGLTVTTFAVPGKVPLHLENKLPRD